MILVNRSELGAGTRGASLGFEALRIASLENNKPIKKFIELENSNEYLYDMNRANEGALNIDAIYSFFSRNLKSTKSFFDENTQNNFIYSADHSSTPIYLAALKSLNLDERIGVIWIDAHGDLHSPYTTPSGNMHGMPLCIALAEDNLESKVRDLDTVTKEIWENLKSLGNKKAKISYQNLAFLGIRDLEKEEKVLIEKNDVYYKKVPEVREIGIDKISKELENKLSNCDRIFISFDVDSMDPDDTSYGTGTPVKGGFTFEETFEITDRLTKINKNISFEMVEINPLLDNQNKMARTALKIFNNVTKNLKIEF